MATRPSFRARWAARAQAPVDAASLAVLRMAFGATLLVAVARFFAHGWIHSYFIAPQFFFSYWGFSWVRPLPGPAMYALFAALGLLAIGITVGLFTRVCTLLFTLGFAYVHLIDKTHYLNHYFLVIALGLLGTTLPWHQIWSLDALRAARAGHPWPTTVPAFSVWVVRAQLGLVYFFGGVAKLRPDWLLHAQPLKIWLAANTDFPGMGAFFDHPGAAYGLSWAGALFDLATPWLLLGRRTRAAGYVLVVGFHLITARLFHLGMFPWLMLVCTPVFFAPAWPRRWAAHLQSALPWRKDAARGIPPAPVPSPLASFPARSEFPMRPLDAPAVAFACALLGAQALLPLRQILYPGNSLWTEEGFRFAFKVMVMEKAGSAEFVVYDPAAGRRFLVDPHALLTPLQVRMMATQPDMIAQFARALAARYRAQGMSAPEVHADVFASLNGRPPARLVDAAVDLAQVPEGLGRKPWILPAPQTPPP